MVAGFTPGPSLDWLYDSFGLGPKGVSWLSCFSSPPVLRRCSLCLTLNANRYYISSAWRPVAPMLLRSTSKGFAEERNLLREEYTDHLKLLVFTSQPEAQAPRVYTRGNPEAKVSQSLHSAAFSEPGLSMHVAGPLFSCVLLTMPKSCLRPVPRYGRPWNHP